LREPAVRALYEREHTEAWTRYLDTDAIPSMDELLADDDNTKATEQAPDMPAA
jgi:hypothetical protein